MPPAPGFCRLGNSKVYDVWQSKDLGLNYHQQVRHATMGDGPRIDNDALADPDRRSA